VYDSGLLTNAGQPLGPFEQLADVEVMPLPSLLDASVDLSRLFEE
jgi:hypothetical protein